MRRSMFRLTYAVIAVILWPGLLLACAYPTPLRVANATLLSILDEGGQVSIHRRDRLARAMAQMSPDVVKRTVSQDARRRDARAAHAVIDAATALASGRGMRLEEDMRAHVMRLDRAADVSCSGSDGVASGSDEADGAEHGTTRETDRGARALTFRERVTRLSLTFTLYMAFLAFLFGLRRQLRERVAKAPAVTESRPASKAEAS